MAYTAEIMILFLIINTTSCLVPGALLFGYGVGAEALTGRQFGTPKGQIVAGLLLIALAAIGYCGAITQNKRKLNFYSVVMVLPLVIDVVGVSLTCAGNGPGSLADLQSPIIACMLIITHILVTVLSIGLSGTMYVQIAVQQAASPSLQQARAGQ